MIRTAREMGIRTIAVYSELDRDALHVDLADEAWNAGPAPAADSYLNQQRILQIAHDARAPRRSTGYGSYPRMPVAPVTDAGIVGSALGQCHRGADKITSRRNAEKFGVPTVPGVTSRSPRSGKSPPRRAVRVPGRSQGRSWRRRQGFAGGSKPEELDDAFEGARREADAYFGNPEVYVEKYLEEPRHVEAQVLYDSQGKGVFLGRDCSFSAVIRS